MDDSDEPMPFVPLTITKLRYAVANLPNVDWEVTYRNYVGPSVWPLIVSGRDEMEAYTKALKKLRRLRETADKATAERQTRGAT